MSTQTWKLEVSTVGGDTRFVDAYKHGKFIVHLPIGQSIADNPDYAPDAIWIVSHRATGLIVTSVWGRAEARRVARNLDAATKTDITPEDYAARNEVWKAFKKAVVEVIQQ